MHGRSISVTLDFQVLIRKNNSELRKLDEQSSTHWSIESFPCTSTLIHVILEEPVVSTMHSSGSATISWMAHKLECYSSGYPAGTNLSSWGIQLAKFANPNVPCAACYETVEQCWMVPSLAKTSGPENTMASSCPLNYGHASPKLFMHMDTNAEPCSTWSITMVPCSSSAHKNHKEHSSLSSFNHGTCYV